jgi:hypothetical protein
VYGNIGKGEPNSIFKVFARGIGKNPLDFKSHTSGVVRTIVNPVKRDVAKKIFSERVANNINWTSKRDNPMH